MIHKQNGGLGYAKDSGLEKCSGEFVMVMDSDDYLNEDSVEVLYYRMISDGSDIAVGKHIDVYEEGRTDGGYCSW